MLFGRELDNIAVTDGFDVDLETRVSEIEAAAARENCGGWKPLPPLVDE
ncbi:MAG: hypothetical protein V1816_22475 [Pseudomonadota bacterium]